MFCFFFFFFSYMGAAFSTKPDTKDKGVIVPPDIRYVGRVPWKITSMQMAIYINARTACHSYSKDESFSGTFDAKVLVCLSVCLYICLLVHLSVCPR
uniref:Putative secreted protein n=1 Tax=Rhipicephalus microplus TaxID=6941 RepID=A0A6M2DCG2_RHIMP